MPELMVRGRASGVLNEHPVYLKLANQNSFLDTIPSKLFGQKEISLSLLHMHYEAFQNAFQILESDDCILIAFFFFLKIVFIYLRENPSRAKGQREREKQIPQ